MEVFENALETRFLKTEIYRILLDADFRKYPDTCGRGLSLNDLRSKK